MTRDTVFDCSNQELHPSCISFTMKNGSKYIVAILNEKKIVFGNNKLRIYTGYNCHVVNFEFAGWVFIQLKLTT